jgi:hypothetical protein
MFSRWIVTNITSASVTTFLAFLAGIISWSVYCIHDGRVVEDTGNKVGKKQEVRTLDADSSFII